MASDSESEPERALRKERKENVVLGVGRGEAVQARRVVTAGTDVGGVGHGRSISGRIRIGAGGRGGGNRMGRGI